MRALYRAYRPQTFDEVVGQEAVVRTLRNAIAADSVAHAYLFTGPKGTGKTTMAKILAKALNCEQGPTVNPCGVCESCVSITESRSVDVVEIDAASNTGVQDVRDKIIDTVNFRPAAGTRRVYILDEAHQLSQQAFNALLKTIEEPPEHVLFVFCTTENHKMLATVRDRCQRFTLAPPSFEQLEIVLRRAADAEGIEADSAALAAIARVAQGSFRNALGTLDHLATAFGRSFTAADVLAHLGAFAEDVMFDAADAVLAGDSQRILLQVEELSQSGADLVQFAYSLAEHLRGVLLASQGVQAQTFAVSDTERLAAQASAADLQRLTAAVDCINDAVARVRAGSDVRLALEVGLVRACQGLGLPSLALRLAVLEQKLLGGVGQPLAPAQAAPPADQPPPAPAATTPPPVAKVDPADTSAWWGALQAAARADAPLAALLGSATPVRFDGTTVVIASPMAGVLRSSQAQLRALASAALGADVAIEIQESAAAAAQPAAAHASADQPAAPAPEVPAAGAERPVPTPPPDEEVAGMAGVPLVEKYFDATHIGQ